MAEGDETTTATDGSTSTATTATTTVTASWRDTLPDDLKADKSLESFKDVAGLAKSFIETKKMVGARSAVPGADAKPEDVAAFRKALGVPDAPEGYALKRPEIAAVLGWDDKAEAGFKAAAHKAGMTPVAAQAAVDYYASMLQTQHDAARAMEREAGAALRTQWGANYDANLGIANRALSQYGGDDLVEFLHTSKLGADPRMVQAWAKVGADLMESGFIRGENIGRVSDEEADTKVRELNAELSKVDPSSDRASQIIDQIVQYRAAVRR